MSAGNGYAALGMYWINRTVHGGVFEGPRGKIEDGLGNLGGVPTQVKGASSSWSFFLISFPLNCDAFFFRKPLIKALGKVRNHFPGLQGGISRTLQGARKFLQEIQAWPYAYSLAFLFLDFGIG